MSARDQVPAVFATATRLVHIYLQQGVRILGANHEEYEINDSHLRRVDGLAVFCFPWSQHTKTGDPLSLSSLSSLSLSSVRLDFVLPLVCRWHTGAPSVEGRMIRINDDDGGGGGDGGLPDRELSGEEIVDREHHG